MKLLKYIIIAASLFWFSVPAQSQELWDTLVDNTLNFYEDQNRESVFDVDNDGTLSVGDVFVGYVRIDDRSVPLPGESLTETYAVFSTQIATITPTDNGDGTSTYQITMESTTVAGLQLSDFGVSNTDATSLVAVYEDVATNLITTSPGDVDGDGVLTIFDFMEEITSASQDLVAGLEEGVDHWVATATFDNAADPFANLNLIELFTLANGTGGEIDFHSGMGITYTEMGTEDCLLDGSEEWCFGRFVGDVVEGGILNPSFHELTVQNGDISGASDLNFAGEGNPYFSGAIVEGNGQLLGYDYYGLSSNADFGIYPYHVPEPSMLALMGLGLIGLGVTGMRRRKAS